MGDNAKAESGAAELSAFREVPAGTRLFRQGERADGAYLIVDGVVEVRRQGTNGAEDIATLAAGDVVGELALFLDGQRTADATVARDARLIFLSRAEFEQRLSGMDPILRRITEILGQRLRPQDRKS